MNGGGVVFGDCCVVEGVWMVRVVHDDGGE